MSDYHAAECGLTSGNNRSNTSDLPEVNSFHEDNWYLDELFNEQRTLNLSIGQDELQSPVFIAPPERLYLPNIPGRLQLD